MNLYLLSQDSNDWFDTWDSCVVVATDFEDAKNIHPISGWAGRRETKESDWQCGMWASSPEEVSVEYIGVADEKLNRGVVCASFNAG